MLDDFIERKHGRKAIAYDLPELKPILEETYGVILYQEQVMQIASRLAGYSLGEADILRRAMGKKKAEEMASQRQRFLKGGLERGFPQRKIEKIFDLMEQFAGYGFNKSHSAAYAYLAFVTAYFKAHYPVDFMAALLTSETGNPVKIAKYINECRDMNITVLPPDVNTSDWTFTPVEDAIRFGLGAVKNLGASAVEAIRAAREQVGRFRSIYQFCDAVDLSSINRRMIESLIRAGAMDTLDGSRAQLMAVVEAAMEAGQRAQRSRLSGQEGLFADAFTEENGHEEKALPTIPDAPLREKLLGEKEMLGFYVTGHPLDQYLDKVRELATHSSGNLEGLEKGVEVALCGVITGVQRKRNREGKPWSSMVLEDHKGAIECLLFTTNYERLASMLAEDQAVLLRGLVLPEENAPPKVSVQDIVPLEVARLPLPSLISIRVWLGRKNRDAATQGHGDTANGDAMDRAAQLSDVFLRKPGDTQVRLRLESPRDFTVILDVPVKVRPDREFRAEIERLCGSEAIEVLAN
jgi:DNA polymerase-3 subunit alpha